MSFIPEVFWLLIYFPWGGGVLVASHRKMYLAFFSITKVMASNKWWDQEYKCIMPEWNVNKEKKYKMVKIFVIMKLYSIYGDWQWMEDHCWLAKLCSCFSKSSVPHKTQWPLQNHKTKRHCQSTTWGESRTSWTMYAGQVLHQWWLHCDVGPGLLLPMYTLWYLKDSQNNHAINNFGN